MELIINNLSIGYPLKGGKRIIVKDGLSLTLYSGAITSLLGLNGVGKSTLLRTICRFQNPFEGDILINGQNISKLSQEEFAKLVGVVLTEKTNAGGISVYELVSLGRQPHTGFFGRLKPHDHEIITQAILSVGMNDKRDSYVSELSDGERQKVMIAKTLAQECPIMILDEPTAFLDATSRIETMILLRKLAHEQGKSILISTHDLDNAIKMSDQLWILGKGLKTVCGTPSELIENDIFAKYFERSGIIFDKQTKSLISTND